MMSPSPSPIRILVADDNEDHRFFITRALRDSTDRELEIVTVRDGAEAIEYLRQQGAYAGETLPHLVILDLKMPRMDGHEVLSEVKADKRLRSIPVAVLSSSDRDEDVRRAYELGGNSYVVKPAADGRLSHGLSTLRKFWTETAVLPNPA